MCLILVAWQPNEAYQLVIAANRDEFYQRPSQRAHYWKENPTILGGKDLLAGGTWLGITLDGRFAAVTNFREDPPNPLPPRSRGELTAEFLRCKSAPPFYLYGIQTKRLEYRGFNLLIGDINHLFYYSNRQDKIVALAPGTYGLSNQLLDCNWEKVIDGRSQLDEIVQRPIDTESLFQLLMQTGQHEHPWSAKFIHTLEYGTCASTVILVKRDGTVKFEERIFNTNGIVLPHQHYEFNIRVEGHLLMQP
jgi:uncharacterized protein with NRDE domain